MDAKEFLDLAQLLYALKTEAACRTSISRSYYAVLHYFLSFLREYNIKITTYHDVHEKAVQYLHNSDIQEAVGLGDILNGLRDIRNDADYVYRKTKINFDENNAKLNYYKATIFFTKLSTINKVELALAIQNYKNTTNN